MKDKGKLPENREADLWKSLDEQDVMQLRSKLSEINIQTKNELQSYNMSSTEDFET